MLGEAVINSIKGFIPEDNICFDVPMSAHTTFRAGGKAACMVEPETIKQLQGILRYLGLVGLPYFILGNGSNTLVKDEGFPGVIVKIGNKFSGVEVVGNVLTARAGTSLAKAAAAAYENGLTGMEFAAGIPGCVGGAVIMNAGAYGGEMKDIVTSVTVINPEGEILRLEPSSVGFRYRSSNLKNRKFVVTEVTFELRQGDRAQIKTLMDDLAQRRREKQPLEFPSAGSTFKRPEGYYAGELIMKAGLKGYQSGGARVSDKHCGFVINTGGATAADILDVIDEVRKRVKDRFGVELEPEIVILG